MTHDWYRNTTWNASVEAAFEEKLGRARDKRQYLRIQAATLASSDPKVALRLLDRYFELAQNNFDLAMAHCNRATAFLALGRVEDAIASYEAALSREAVYPQVQTGAYLELPYLIATRQLRWFYNRALDILDAGHERPIFPVDFFRWHAARALIAAETKQSAAAREHALKALEAASLGHSGFRYHPTIGLVTDEHAAVVRKLKGYVR
jgi:tetratricopeptide (TPR) repeat protein